MNKNENKKKVLLTGLKPTGTLTLGNYIGAKFFERKGASGAKKIILVVLVLFIVKLGYDLFVKVWAIHFVHIRTYSYKAMI